MLASTVLVIAKDGVSTSGNGGQLAETDTGVQDSLPSPAAGIPTAKPSDPCAQMQPLKWLRRRVPSRWLSCSTALPCRRPRRRRDAGRGLTALHIEGYSRPRIPVRGLSFFPRPLVEDETLLTRLLQPPTSDEMDAYEVSRLVNSPKNNSAACI